MNTSHCKSFELKKQFFDKLTKSTNGLKFAYIINKNGRPLHTFNKDFLVIDDKKKEMLFIETALQASMNKDFDDELGKIQCNVTERNDLKYVSAPLSSKNIIFAALDKQIDHNTFVTNINRIKDTLD